MIKRIKDYTKHAPTKDAHKIYIVCEGKETEPEYFSFFKGLSSNLQVITIPPGSGTDPLKLMERAENVLLGEQRTFSVDYKQKDTVWFVIDTDTWEKEGKIKPLREFCANQNRNITEVFNEIKSYDAWNVAQSNPCFEIWMYYHFYDSKPHPSEIAHYASFKSYVNQAINGGFNYERDQVFLERAIHHTANNFATNEQGLIADFSSEVYLLGKEILGFVKKDLDKLRNKF